MSKPGLARWFGRVPVLRAGAGECARRRSNFLLLRQKKVTKEKATPSLRPLRGAKGQTCGGAVAGCAVELALLLRSAARTATASQITKHARSDARATPQPPRRRRSHRGWTADNSRTATRVVAALDPVRAASPARRATYSVVLRAIDAPKSLGLRDRTALPPFVATFARWLVLSLWGWTRTRCWCYWVGTWPRAGLPHRAL